MHCKSFARDARRWPAGSLALVLALLGAPAAFGANHNIAADRSAGRQRHEIREMRQDLAATTNRRRPAGWSAGAVCLGSGYRRAGGSRRVRELQRWLRARGYRPGRVDGRFGPRTRAALLAFQVKQRLRPSGAVDASTLTALRWRPARPQRAAAAPPPPPPRSVPTGPENAAIPAGWSAGAVCLGSGYRRAGGSRRVRELQRWLRARGYRPGRVD